MRSTARRVLDLCVHLPVGVAITVAERRGELVRLGRRRLASLRSFHNPSPWDDDTPTGTSVDTTDAADPVDPRLAAYVASLDGGVPDADTLPIAEYDALAARQVVARLDRLSPEERTRIGAYEASRRARVTILRRLAELDGS